MSTRFKLIPINQQYAQQATVILAEAFLDEPMQRALGTPYEDILEFMEHLVRHAMATNLSTIVIDTEIDKVVGVSINKDLLDEPIGEHDHFSEGLLPIFELLDQLDGEYQKYHKVNRNEVYHSLILAIDANYRNKGIPALFHDSCVKMAREHGFKTMLAELTGPISTYVVVGKFGFKKLHGIKYTDFSFNGSYPFKNIKDAEYCYLAYKPVPAK